MNQPENAMMTPSTLHKRGSGIGRGAGPLLLAHNTKKARRDRLPGDKPVVVRVRCCGKLHRVAWWTDGRITLVDHGWKDKLARQTLKDLGDETECECLKLLRRLAQVGATNAHPKMTAPYRAARGVKEQRRRNAAINCDGLEQRGKRENTHPGSAAIERRSRKYLLPRAARPASRWA